MKLLVLFEKFLHNLLLNNLVLILILMLSLFLQTVQKDATAELDVIEKRIRRQETDVGRMKDEYHREVLRLRNLVKQKEIIIGRLQREKMWAIYFSIIDKKDIMKIFSFFSKHCNFIFVSVPEK